uniref:Transposase n=1 Tax=Peronospora matthiolae TaxID=2874970 RepID=A0AAV1TIX8_9STRA
MNGWMDAKLRLGGNIRVTSYKARKNLKAMSAGSQIKMVFERQREVDLRRDEFTAGFYSRGSVNGHCGMPPRASTAFP